MQGRNAGGLPLLRQQEETAVLDDEFESFYSLGRPLMMVKSENTTENTRKSNPQEMIIAPAFPISPQGQCSGAVVWSE